MHAQSHADSDSGDLRRCRRADRTAPSSSTGRGAGRGGPIAGPAHWTQSYPEDGWDAFCLSVDSAPVVGAKSLLLGAHHSVDDTPPSTSSSPRAGPAPGRCSRTRATSTGSAPPGSRSP